MAKDKLGIVNQALINLGDEPVTSFETDDGAGIEAARLIYENVVKNCFTTGAYKWRFAVKQQTLKQLNDPPLGSDRGGYKYAYALPSKFLSLVQLNKRVDYEIYGQELRTDAKELIIDYIERIDESLWPHYFDEIVILSLTIKLCKPVADDQTLKQSYQLELIEARRDGKLIDSKNVPNKPFSDSPLLAARRGRRGVYSRTRR